MNPNPTIQPPFGSSIDWSHPLAQGLIVCVPHNNAHVFGSTPVNIAYLDHTGSYGNASWIAGKNGWMRDYTISPSSYTYDVISTTDKRHCGLGEITIAVRMGKLAGNVEHRVADSYIDGNNGILFRAIGSDLGANFYNVTSGSYTNVFADNVFSLLPDESVSAVVWRGGSIRRTRFYRDGVNLGSSQTKATGPTLISTALAGWRTLFAPGQKNTMVSGIWIWDYALVPFTSVSGYAPDQLMRWHAAEPYAMVAWPGLKRYFFGGAVGQLDVTPSTDLVSSGYTGGPFSPITKDYTLTNTGDLPLDWTATKTQTWVTLSSTSGTLAGHASTVVTVSINSNAHSLPYGDHADAVTFTNTTNGNGNTTRDVSLEVLAIPGTLSVTPSSSTFLDSTGPQGGPFTPTSIEYTLHYASGEADFYWTVTVNHTWLDVSLVSGTLGVGESQAVTISLNADANSLIVGSYSAVITFTNTTNEWGNTTRPVTLIVTEPLTGSLLLNLVQSELFVGGGM